MIHHRRLIRLPRRNLTLATDADTNTNTGTGTGQSQRNKLEKVKMNKQMMKMKCQHVPGTPLMAIGESRLTVLY